MANEIVLGQNELIKDWTKTHLMESNAEKNRLGIKHNRTQNAIPGKAKFYSNNGAIERIAISMSKYEIFSMKGIGKGGTRVQKPFFAPIDNSIEELADKLAEVDAELIINHLAID